jgi:hypothetical protein
MSLKKLPLIWLTIFSLQFMGCKNLPTKPQIQLCILDASAQRCYCSITNTEKIKDAEGLTYVSAINLIKSGDFADEYPLVYCHKAIAFRPINWNILQNYIHDLENFIKYQCK